MTQPLTGLSGIAQLQTIVDDPGQATAEDRSGGVADSAHGQFLAEQSIPRGSRMGAPVGPIGPENQLLGDFDAFVLTPAGNEWQDPYFDHTPSRRAGPWPKGIASGPIEFSPDETASNLRQSYALHGIDTNAEAYIQHGMSEPLNDQWDTVEQINSGHTDVGTVPNQMKSSGFTFGTRDRVQSFARQNEFGFDSAHQHRRFAIPNIPGNYMWLQPGGRPMIKTLAGPARPPIGPNSPFTGDDLGQSFNIDGALLQNVPSEYVGPPQPTLGPSIVADSNDSVVEWY